MAVTVNGRTSRPPSFELLDSQRRLRRFRAPAGGCRRCPTLGLRFEECPRSRTMRSPSSSSESDEPRFMIHRRMSDRLPRTAASACPCWGRAGSPDPRSIHHSEVPSVAWKWIVPLRSPVPSLARRPGTNSRRNSSIPAAATIPSRGCGAGPPSAQTACGHPAGGWRVLLPNGDTTNSPFGHRCWRTSRPRSQGRLHQRCQESLPKLRDTTTQVRTHFRSWVERAPADPLAAGDNGIHPQEDSARVADEVSGSPLRALRNGPFPAGSQRQGGRVHLCRPLTKVGWVPLSDSCTCIRWPFEVGDH